MSRSPAKDIASKLSELNFGTEGTNIFANDIPGHIDNLIAVFDTGGLAPDNVMGGSSVNPAFENVTIQVRVRNNSNSTAQQNIYDIFRNLNCLSAICGSTDYLLIQAMQSPLLMEKDENERYNYVCNFIAVRRPS